MINLVVIGLVDLFDRYYINGYNVNKYRESYRGEL